MANGVCVELARSAHGAASQRGRFGRNGQLVLCRVATVSQLERGIVTRLRVRSARVRRALNGGHAIWMRAQRNGVSGAHVQRRAIGLRRVALSAACNRGRECAWPRATIAAMEKTSSRGVAIKFVPSSAHPQIRSRIALAMANACSLRRWGARNRLPAGMASGIGVWGKWWARGFMSFTHVRHVCSATCNCTEAWSGLDCSMKAQRMEAMKLKNEALVAHVRGWRCIWCSTTIRKHPFEVCCYRSRFYEH